MVGGYILTFTRYSFTTKLSCTTQSSWYCPAHLHCSHDLQYDCTTFAHYTTLPRLSLRIPYTIQFGQRRYRVKVKLDCAIVVHYFRNSVGIKGGVGGGHTNEDWLVHKSVAVNESLLRVARVCHEQALVSLKIKQTIDAEAC